MIIYLLIFNMIKGFLVIFPYASSTEFQTFRGLKNAVLKFPTF